MTEGKMYLFAADAVLFVHVLFVAFVVLGLLAIYMGAWRSWAWVRNIWFRVFHLAGIVVVVLEAWAGVVCPLTIWEMKLRELAGQSAYEGSFIQHWLQSLLYYDAPAWVFTTVYTFFAALVLASWYLVPPRRHGKL